MMQIRHSFPFLVLNCIERGCARNTTMAPTAQLHVLAQPRPFACKRRQIRNIAARAAVLEAPNAVPGELEAEAAEMKSMYSEFAELMQGTVMTFKPGDSIMGTVVDVTRKGAFVDIGGKGAAFVSTEELSVASVADASEILRAGMARRFTVLGTRYEVVQLSMAVQEKAIMWQRLRQMQEEDCTIPGTVLSSNRGGVMVSVMNTRGFVPNSHIGPVADKESLMGTDLQLKFLEVDESAGKLLLSARRVRSADSLANYRVGDVVEGVVTKVIHFGAFLELADGISGLLHISQVSHDRVMNMEKLINVGDRMKVMIMSHDRERERLALSTKKLEPTPGDMLKDPAIVFARAEEMASLFKVRVAAAEQAAKEDEQQQLQAAAESQPQAESVQATETW